VVQREFIEPLAPVLPPVEDGETSQCHTPTSTSVESMR